MTSALRLTLTGSWLAVQLYAGIIVLFSLLKPKHTSRQGVVRILLCHMLFMEIANITGVVTAIYGLLWCLGPSSSLEEANGQSTSPLWDQLSHQWSLTWSWINRVTNTAFVLSGLLTDGILVSLLTLGLFHVSNGCP